MFYPSSLGPFYAPDVRQAGKRPVAMFMFYPLYVDVFFLIISLFLVFFVMPSSIFIPLDTYALTPDLDFHSAHQVSTLFSFHILFLYFFCFVVYPSVPRELGAVFRFVGVVAMLAGVRFGVCAVL